MGGEGGAEVTVPAAARILAQRDDLELVLVGDRERIEPLLGGLPGRDRDRLRLAHAELSISDAERPGAALRNARNSSMFLAVDMVKRGEAGAMVSAGNSGALLMIGRYLLKTIPGIHKPAMVATIPGATRQSLLLDVGANPECGAEQLFEFAVMGSVLAESVQRAPARVGLLNIGVEQYKGAGAVREAAARLAECPAIDYAGFVEANEIYHGPADVVVCDGFVGNVTIKASEGVANVIRELLQQRAAPGLAGRESGHCPDSVTRALTMRINPERFNGACLLGLQGSIVKSHGNASELGFSHAILEAANEIDYQIPRLIADKVEQIMASA